MWQKLKNQKKNHLPTQVQLHTDYVLMYEMKQIKWEKTHRKFKPQILGKSNQMVHNMKAEMKVISSQYKTSSPSIISPQQYLTIWKRVWKSSHDSTKISCPWLSPQNCFTAKTWEIEWNQRSSHPSAPWKYKMSFFSICVDWKNFIHYNFCSSIWSSRFWMAKNILYILAKLIRKC